MTGTGSVLLTLKSRTGEIMSRFRTDCEGVAALEFALIAPIMIMLFVGTLEVSAAVSVNRKVSRISSVVGDLVTQSADLSRSDITNIMDVSSDIMRPYKNVVKIRITVISIDKGKATVVKGCNQNWSSVGSGEIYTVPSKIKINGTVLVAARVQTVYQPMVGWTRHDKSSGVKFDNTAVTMNEEIFLRPRIGSNVKVSC